MESDWATEHLQVIRTLMERSAVYRRALAPIMLFTGAVGLLAAIAGTLLPVQSPRAFIAYWLAVSLVPLVGAFLLVRRQALRAAEPFWSPPTRHVAQAILPPFTAALLVSAAMGVLVESDARPGLDPRIATGLMPIAWVVLYGCASHAAGFFMPRGIKLFGWIFVLGGCLSFPLGLLERPDLLPGHGLMGFFFGVLHLAYGGYLLFTEPRTNAA